MWSEAVRGSLPFLLAAAVGCQSGYVVTQGWSFLSNRGEEVPIDDPELLRSLSPEAAEKLRWVPRVLEFCKAELGLDPGDSYRYYLDTGGVPVTHIVTASHALALLPYLWSFPFVGEVPYKGYYAEEDAVEEAARLRSLGFDAEVNPVGAYSTLGWFSDPVLSTMLEGELPDLVDILIHETTHRTVYFPGRASFNESLATHIAREGTVRFLFRHEELKGLLPAYVARRRAEAERERLLSRLRNDLDTLYRSAAPDAEKYARKAEIFAAARAAFHALHSRTRAGWPPTSNAFVLSVARYHEYETLLARLQSSRGGEPTDLVGYLAALPRDADPMGPIAEEIDRLRWRWVAANPP